jgi:acyl-CoA synthetase (AMP-forming)/AMP-acid ligase II
MNLMMLLEMAASAIGDRAALTCGDVTMSYSELYEATGAAAGEIEESGATCAAVIDVNSPAVPIALFASAWAGVPFSPLNYRLTAAELEALLERVSPAFVVTDPDRAATIESIAGLHVVQREEFLSRVMAGTAGEPSWSMDPDEIAILLFTSGTTGTPKAAVLRHKHVVSYILGSVEFAGAAESDASLISVPPYHIAGMASIASSVYAGRRMVQLESFSADGWIDLASSEAVTHAMVVPTMLVRIIDALDRRGGMELPNLRAVSYGGAKMPQGVIERAMELLPQVDFTNAYGLTETSSTITVLTPDDHRLAMASDDPDVRRRLGSLGRPLPSIELEIRDDEGVAVGAGDWGEIHVRGEQISGEYLEQGSRLQSDGWFPTRDRGSLDAEGYLFLEGRIDDIIVRGGENISPGEVEDVLLAHDAVVDCAVVGIADEQWGEAVAAAVVLHDDRTATEAELQEWVRSQLRSSRSPSRIEFRSELPYNETGKLLRRQVRAEMES